MNKTRNLSNIIIATCFFLFISCDRKIAEEIPSERKHDESNKVEITSEQWRVAEIDTGRVEFKQISGTIKVNGALDVPPQQLISVSAPLGGFLKKTDLLQGSRVEKGQVIATIENLDFIQLQQDYLEAKSNFEFAKADYERQQELAKENVNSNKALQQAKANYANWRAKHSGLREKLKVVNINIASVEEGNIRSSINLHSPIDGYVTQVNVNIGKFVTPTDVLFEIVDTEHLHAELTVFEKDVPKVKIGQKVRFTLANETKERMATVFLIGREINADRTIRIHCHLDREDKELLPGMYLMAIVETSGVTVPALPNEAIVDYQGKKYIFILSGKADLSTKKDQTVKPDQHHFEMVEVQTGNSELGYTEMILLEDFDSKNARVVVKGAYSLLSKMKNNEEEEDHGH